MNGLGLLLIGCGVGCYALLRAVFRAGERFDANLASFNRHVATAPGVIDGCLTVDESTRWVEIVNGFGPRGSIA